MSGSKPGQCVELVRGSFRNTLLSYLQVDVALHDPGHAGVDGPGISKALGVATIESRVLTHVKGWRMFVCNCWSWSREALLQMPNNLM